MTPSVAGILRATTVAALAALAAGVCGSAIRAADDVERITIATGSVAGVYYPVGGAICRLVNRERKQNGLRCDVDVTGGSVANVGLLLDGFYEFAIVQSDVLADLAVLPVADGAPRRAADLRAVLRLHPEVLTIAVRDGIVAAFDDLKGRRIAAGTADSGHQASFALLRRLAGWSGNDASNVIALDTTEQAIRLCAGEIDAFVNVVGHPTASVIEAGDRCGVTLLPLDAALVARAAGERVGFRAVDLPADAYRHGVRASGRSIGLDAVLVTARDVAPERVAAVAGAVLRQFAAWRRMHPALERLDAADRRPDGLPIPPHEGALAAFDAAR